MCEISGWSMLTEISNRCFFLKHTFNFQLNDSFITDFSDSKQQTVSYRMSLFNSGIRAKEKLIAITTPIHYVFVYPPDKSLEEIVALVTELSGNKFSINFQEY
jgi:hypothetical protein